MLDKNDDEAIEALKLWQIGVRSTASGGCLRYWGAPERNIDWQSTHILLLSKKQLDEAYSSSRLRIAIEYAFYALFR